MAGVNAIQSVRRLRPDARIVAVARTAADYTTILALEAGVMGCVVSTAGGGELLQAIRAVHQGRLALPWDVDEAFGAHGVQRTLTPRQVEVLQLIAAGLRNADISTRHRALGTVMRLVPGRHWRQFGANAARVSPKKSQRLPK